MMENFSMIRGENYIAVISYWMLRALKERLTVG